MDLLYFLSRQALSAEASEQCPDISVMRRKLLLNTQHQHGSTSTHFLRSLLEHNADDDLMERSSEHSSHDQQPHPNLSFSSTTENGQFCLKHHPLRESGLVRRHGQLFDTSLNDEVEAELCCAEAEFQNDFPPMGKFRSNSCVFSRPFRVSGGNGTGNGCSSEAAANTSSYLQKFTAEVTQRRRRSCCAALNKSSEQPLHLSSAPYPTHSMKWKLHHRRKSHFSYYDSVTESSGFHSDVTAMSTTTVGGEYLLPGVYGAGMETASSSMLSPCNSSVSSNAGGGVGEEVAAMSLGPQHDVLSVMSSASSHDSRDNTELHKPTSDADIGSPCYQSWLVAVLNTFFPERDKQTKGGVSHSSQSGLVSTESLLNPFLTNSTSLETRRNFLQRTWPLLFALHLCEERHLPGMAHLNLTPPSTTPSVADWLWSGEARRASTDTRPSELVSLHEKLVSAVRVLRDADLPPSVFAHLRIVMPLLAMNTPQYVERCKELLLNTLPPAHKENPTTSPVLMALQNLLSLELNVMQRLFSRRVSTLLENFLDTLATSLSNTMMQQHTPPQSSTSSFSWSRDCHVQP